MSEQRLDSWSDFNLAAELDLVASDPTMTSERAESILSQDSINADGAAAFIEKYGRQNAFTAEALTTWLDQRGAPYSLKNLEIAYRTLASEGWPLEKAEPEPAAPDTPRVITVRKQASEDVVEPEPAEPVVVRRETGEVINVNEEIAKLNLLARDPRVPDIIRKNADQRLRLLVKTQIAQSRQPRINEQVVII